MWKHIAGVSKPAEKRKLTDEDRRERDNEYDKTKRSRNYGSKWEKDFPWLMLDTNTGHMMCRPCKEHPTLSDSTCAFVKGTSNFRVIVMMPL